MADAPGTGGPGLFQDIIGSAPTPDEVAPGVSAPLLDPGSTPVLLGLVARMISLEGQLRRLRVEGLATGARLEIQVLDNKEAEEKIRELQAEIKTQGGDLVSVRQILEIINGVGRAVVSAFRHPEVATAIAQIGIPSTPFQILLEAIAALEAELTPRLLPPGRLPPGEI